MSLFKRPAWATKSQTAETEDALEEEENLFSHSERSYREIVEEQERKKREKLEKRKAKGQRRSSGKRELEEDLDGGSVKKRRITPERGDGDVGLGANDVEEAMVFRGEDKAVRKSPRINRHADPASQPPAKMPAKLAQVVTLDDSDDSDGGGAGEATRTETVEVEVEEVQDESDEEFAELARRARLQRQQRELQDKKPSANSPTPGQDIADTGREPPPTPPPDPTIQVFISSRIPNTNPLIVHRKLSQRLKELREVWCKKQGFSEEFSKDVFLIHGVHRCFDVTSCRSLGLTVDAFGSVVMKGAEGKEGVENVHLEAVTEEIFAQRRAEKARESQRRSGELPPEEQAEAGAGENDGAAQAQEGDSIIRITMKAKGRKDFKLKVKPNTLVSKVIGAYRKTHQLDGGQHVSVEFDGERLDPELQVQDTEITDMDCVDVHLS